MTETRLELGVETIRLVMADGGDVSLFEVSRDIAAMHTLLSVAALATDDRRIRPSGFSPPGALWSSYRPRALFVRQASPLEAVAAVSTSAKAAGGFLSTLLTLRATRRLRNAEADAAEARARVEAAKAEFLELAYLAEADLLRAARRKQSAPQDEQAAQQIRLAAKGVVDRPSSDEDVVMQVSAAAYVIEVCLQRGLPPPDAKVLAELFYQDAAKDFLRGTDRLAEVEVLE